MGMFDYIIFTTPQYCRHCGKQLGTDFQTKSFKCCMNKLKEGQKIEPTDTGDNISLNTKGNGWYEACQICKNCRKYVGYTYRITEWTLTAQE